jgi:holo-[acyl-carrier protein] synthase
MCALSVGIDLVDARDVEYAVERFGERYLSRVFTSSEVAYARAARTPTLVALRLGARFAAKEAAMKALGVAQRGISPRAIEVVRAKDGSVGLALSGAAFAAASDVGTPALSLSLSHEGHWAVAVVVAETRTKP